MSSKNANPSARVWSLTRRLTLLYVASTAALLLVAAGFLHWALARNLDARDHALLASKVQVLRLLLREHPERTDVLASEVEHEASESPLKYFLRILDARGRVLLETPGMGERLPVALFPAPAAAADSPESVGRHARHHGSFLLVSVTAPVGTDGRETRTLQAALDISLDTALLADYRRKLLAVLALGIAFAGVAGVWVASRGLRPMAEITKTARHISATQLHERITASQWPSELAELAAAFNAMLNRLEDSFTRLSQFSADLAHELRTPINNLRGEAEVALARARTPQEYQEILASSLEEYERLARMMDGLLFLARADNPDAAVERGRFDARKEIEAVREFYEALAAEQRVAVDCEGQATLAGDPVLFRRAVGNLLANALRHTPANGTVTLTARALDDGSAAITVRDTGSGIAPEHLPRIFDRFYRADPARSDVARGTGLGLAIVQSIMRLHGGAASVQSMPGRGTVVTLKFPAGGPLAPPEQMTKM